MGQPELYAVLSIIGGIVSTFWGYRVFKWVLSLAGFAVGAMIALEMNALFEIPGNLGIITIFGVGFLFAILAHYLYRFGILLFGAFIGYGMSPSVVVRIPEIPSIVVIMVCSMVFAFLIWKLEKPFVVIITVLAGASTIVSGLAAIIYRLDITRMEPALPQDPGMKVLTLVSLGVLIALGLSAQIGWTARDETSG